MRFFREEPTSITVAIDRLSNMYEMEWFTFQHLMESIAMQEQGPKEALDVIQKRLKHGTCHQQLRLLEVLNYLVERSHLLSHAVATPKLKSRLKAMMKSKADPKVKSHIEVLLEMWIRKYSGQEPKVIKFATCIIQLGQNRALDKSDLYRHNPSSTTELVTSSEPMFMVDPYPRATGKSIDTSLTSSLAGFSPFSRRYQNLSSSGRHVKSPL
ncbi:hypothetical protein [Absidia glauca]|uniref:VHS domain-containing protein n=1 Tax=Absidia glauca TaxID=4829 RepID=A0A168S1Q7_ABSGL|nr:hypothetical protein [Absidia glauca]